MKPNEAGDQKILRKQGFYVLVSVRQNDQTMFLMSEKRLMAPNCSSVFHTILRNNVNF